MVVLLLALGCGPAAVDESTDVDPIDTVMDSDVDVSPEDEPLTYDFDASIGEDLLPISIVMDGGGAASKYRVAIARSN